MNDECKGILSIVLTAVLALVIIVSLLWWVSGLAHGVFALGPFTSLMIGITVAGICSGGRRS
ncbi:hypothetical protein [Bifidobacterium mongoliense]|uniref:hypothetical protein n=1 Tax=Bifidobacterium mongoliense TaxID=518643 RepID=UPI00264A202B|nr:hypothetical protein [Bifidobacterium mongoliense]MDN5980084.1 hypothetical protein [Bifidobacterium mongoliense]